MNEEYPENKMENIRENMGRRRHEGRLIAGALFIIIGAVWLLEAMHLIISPSWFFTWPLFVILFGLFSGIRHRFRGGFWILIMLFGFLMLLNKMDPTLELNRFVGPFIILGIGLMFIFKPHRSQWRRWDRRNRHNWRNDLAVNTSASGMDAEPDPIDRRDFLDVTAVFGGVKKNVLSKNFRGGDIVSFMGGSEIDLTQADFQGRIKIDTTNIFGGTKLIVPPTWDVQSDMVAIFGGVDDKRQISGVKLDPNKVLILDGTCMFGGIEIKSY